MLKTATAPLFLRGMSLPDGSDCRARRLRPLRHLAVRVGLPRSRLLGDGGLRSRDGHGLVRRAHRAQPRSLLAARLAARSRRGQDPRARGADHARRRRAWRPAGWSRRSSSGSSSSRRCAWPHSNEASCSQARDLGKLKTWSQAVAAAVGGFAGCRGLAERHRVVDAARRRRADVDLRAGLRPRRPAPLARRRDGLIGLLLGPGP